jgi:hypothetical protein
MDALRESSIQQKLPFQVGHVRRGRAGIRLTREAR